MSDLRQRYERIRQVYVVATRRPVAERAAFLAAECGDDAELRAEVDSLLAAEEETTALDTLALRMGVRAAASGVDDPERIGPYRVLQKIGEGGMGVVYLAEQEEPIRRRVALKIVKPGMDSAQVLARFEAERQALAIMNHPGIAKVHDAGQTPEGRPYFVMEYVRGEPITEYCDRQRLAMDDRLELFIRACEAVQHAHHKAVIHRDLKPSNILVSVVDGKAAPKIIDFGVAKAIEHRLTERTLFTELGVLLGTPEYMSPEQAEMGATDVDTRTDIYSLGVVLYELLTGALPFDPKELRSAGYDEIRRRIREEEPSKPSTRISTLGDVSIESARKRRVEPRGLTRELRGDLDWITMRALEKDRTRRYESPAAFAADVRRHLDREPVEAGPPTVRYRLGRFVGRHRVGVALAVLAAGAVVAFAATMAIQAARIARANEDLETVVAFQTGMLSEMDTLGMGRRLLDDLRERVDRAAVRRGLDENGVAAASSAFDDLIVGVSAPDAALRLIDEEILERSLDAARAEFGERPEIAARLIHAIGWTYEELGLHERAENPTREAVEVRTRLLGADHPDTLASRHNLALILGQRGRYDEAEQVLLPTFEARRRVLGPEDPETLESMTWLGGVYYIQRRFEEAEAMLTKSLEAQKRVLGADDRRTLITAGTLGSTYSGLGRKDEAYAMLAATLAAQRRALGREHPDTLHNMMRLAKLAPQEEECEALFVEAIEIGRRTLGDDSPGLVWGESNLGWFYTGQGRYDEAEALFEEAIARAGRTLGLLHPDAMGARQGMARLFTSTGRMEEAARWYADLARDASSEFGADERLAAHCLHLLGWTLSQLKRHDEAEDVLVEAVDRNRRVRGADDPETLRTMIRLAESLFWQERFTDAEEVYVQTYDAGHVSPPEGGGDVAEAAFSVACLRARASDLDGAWTWLERAVGLHDWDPDVVASDSYLAPLHGARFDALLAQLRERAETGR